MQVYHTISHTLTVYFHNTYFKVTRVNTLKYDDCCTHFYLIIAQEFVTRFVFMSNNIVYNYFNDQPRGQGLCLLIMRPRVRFPW